MKTIKGIILAGIIIMSGILILDLLHASLISILILVVLISAYFSLKQFITQKASRTKFHQKEQKNLQKAMIEALEEAKEE